MANIRLIITTIFFAFETIIKIYRTIKGLKMDKKTREDVQVANQRLLYYPHALFDCEEMPTKGVYPAKYPEGAVIHFTAGRSKNGAENARGTISYGKRMDHCYFCISADGKVFQPMPLDRWGYHAGQSSFAPIGNGVSSRMVGIEVCCGGQLEKTADGFKSWFGDHYSEDEVRFSKYQDNIMEGYYHKFTQAQEKALIDLLLWIKGNNPDVFKLEWVLGHDEVSPRRKADPGASLSMCMPKFRDYLKELYKNGLSAPAVEFVKQESSKFVFSTAVNEDIKKLQLFLNSHGSNLKVDGIAGTETSDEFKKAFGSYLKNDPRS